MIHCDIALLPLRKLCVTFGHFVARQSLTFDSLDLVIWDARIPTLSLRTDKSS